jgi:CCR4-NOT transcription complex subunit 7/8
MFLIASDLAHSGYDFGYWVKLLTSSPLPTSEDEFFNLLSLWFPTVYDVKCLLRAAQGPKGNLHDVAEEMQVRLQAMSTLLVTNIHNY